MGNRFRRAFFTLVLAGFSASLFAQPSILTGRVLDSTNAVLPGVTVEAIRAGYPTAVTVTGGDGNARHGLEDVAGALERPPLDLLGGDDVCFAVTTTSALEER